MTARTLERWLARVWLVEAAAVGVLVAIVLTLSVGATP